MSTYTARARPWEHGWELYVDGVGVTQCRVLDRAEQQVRDFLATWLDRDMDDATITVTVDLDEDVRVAIADARALTAHVQQQTREAAAASRAVARQLRAEGLSVADTAYLLHVSRGRVSQLVRS